MEPNKQGKQTLAPGGLSVATICIILAIAAIAVTVVFWGISLGRKYQASSIEKKLSSVQDETDGLGGVNKQAQTIYAAEQNIKGINKKYWSVFLSELSADTVKNISLSEMATDDEDKITLTGATVNYNALSKFMVALRNSSKISDVEVIFYFIKRRSNGRKKK
ncbi:MAG: PilN domain-containing protein [Candidatus Berkelbacteria bacterium]|nr:PilN domain-containing protein [Candidatus Berkelbacteria bacterium]